MRAQHLPAEPLRPSSVTAKPAGSGELPACSPGELGLAAHHQAPGTRPVPTHLKHGFSPGPPCNQPS